MRVLKIAALISMAAAPAFAQAPTSNLTGSIIAAIPVVILVVIVFWLLRAWSASSTRNAEDVAVDTAANVIKAKRKAQKSWNDFVDKARDRANR